MTDKRKFTKFKDRDRGLLWPRLLILLAIAISAGQSYFTNNDFLCTFEKPICRWKWNSTLEDGFHIMSGIQASIKHNATQMYAGPFTDSSNLYSGHYLNLLNTSGMKEVHLWSSRLSHTLRDCRISVWLYMVNMTDGVFRVVANAAVPWVIAEIKGNNDSTWQRFEFIVGRIQQDFSLLLAVAGNGTNPSHAALDHIELKNCFPEVNKPKLCTTEYFRCSPQPDDRDFCLNRTQLCDIRIDCISAADEKQGCDLVPEVGRCDFEKNWCSWRNSPKTAANWTRRGGIVVDPRRSGLGHDRISLNITGMFLYANMSDPHLVLGDMALIDSSNINPPPRYHSRPESEYYLTCNVRFFYHQYGRSSGSFALYLIEHQPQGDKTTRLYYTFGDKGDTWIRGFATIPTDLQYSFQLQFEVRKGLRGGGDVALDDFTLSPECFGINVPEKEKEGYNYDTFKGFPAPTVPTETHVSFLNSTVYTFTTCGSTGRTGPTPENCTKAYNNTNIDVTVVEDLPIKGIQKWIVPETNYYTIIAKGAAGGPGPEGRGGGYGATAIGIVKLYVGQEILMLVGQEGNGGCRRNFAMMKHQPCQRIIPAKPTPPGPRFSPPRRKPPPRPADPFSGLTPVVLKFGGGGGGGGTFVYQIDRGGRKPLVVGSGGGGAGGGRGLSESAQHGKGIDPTRLGLTGMEYGINSPGGGGGWHVAKNRTRDVTGISFMEGGIGGHGCGFPKDYHGMGGFGAGGGGCITGGGGGGFSGGSAGMQWKNGRGGYSFVDYRMRGRRVIEGNNPGPGSVTIIPAVKGCGCGYLCAALDEHLEYVRCICWDGTILDENTPSCDDYDTTTTEAPTTRPTRPAPTIPPYRQLQIREEYVFIFAGALALSMLCLVGQVVYKCYTKKRMKRKGRQAGRDLVQMEAGEAIQLERLDSTPEDMTTEENPTYEAAGLSIDFNEIKLPDIPRESLRFAGALGQGAFGEVYRGFYKETPESPEELVAVKTLPTFTSTDSESDFFMEAVIMSKFSHPNIVRFIGVCFDRHPRFIVLELLAGGDLKNFLREHRPDADNPNRLTMTELLKFARDVALGCAYLERRRFIHRDIAARNCLLTSKGPDKMVKIADFGMAKDIYRSEYYRKAGKALLPVKWMPPEAFQDGVFTAKTDVWSYGVLLWEVMSVGFLPYSGMGNQQVMPFVVKGGRLSCPRNCPREIYALMKHCWHREPEERPTFVYILDRVRKFLQNPRITNTSLPLFVKGARVRRRRERRARGQDGEASGRPDREDDFEDDDDDGMIADEVGALDGGDDAGAAAAARPAAVADSQVTYAETDFSNPQPGTSKSAMGKNSYSDSLETVFVVPSEPSTKQDPQPGISGWSKRGKDKSFDFSRRWSVSEAVTTDPAVLPHELPVISATRGPLGPKGRLKPSELMKYRMNIDTVGKIDQENIHDEPSDDEESTYC